MADEIKGDGEKQKTDQRLNVNVQISGTVLTNKAPTNDKTAESNQEKEVTKVAWSRRIGRWVWAILTSPEFWTAAATVVIAAFTVELYGVSNRQGQTMDRQLEMSERPWLSAGVKIIGPLIFDQTGTGDMFGFYHNN
jgi:hypothetical protein